MTPAAARAAVLAGLLALTWATGVVAAEAETAEVARGRYLVAAGGCRSCHTAERPDAAPFAGGRALKTPFGTFYAPNITPDPETGIGRWRIEDVVRALREGVRPDGQPYFPAFPYPAYAGLSEADARAIGAFLLNQAPVRQTVPAHDLPWFLATRWVMVAWNLVNFSPGGFSVDRSRSPEWNRGAYLVRHLGHCGECHTPRDWLGAPDIARELAGNAAGPDGDVVPNITPDPDSGIGRWTADEITLFLETGMLPDGDFSGASMSEVIDDNTSRLTPADRAAIASYLAALTPHTAPPR